ncbi:MAG: acetate/propionate family kinase [Deltaproteobacteria bacterium]|nr:acetate/propionate family kinase [Deltaproteobacteria bacterium]
MPSAILVLNAGSSSVKFSLHDRDAAGSFGARLRGQVEGIGVAPRLEARDEAGRDLVRRALDRSADQEAAIACLLDFVSEHLGPSHIAAVGHRVVHGGIRFGSPVRIDDAVIAEIERLVPLAPLHQPHHVAAIHAVARIAPALPQVACFDTSFHHGQPPLARAFALPRALSATGVRRYGFHGLSYEYVASVLPEIAPGVARGRVVVAHLGNGASLCAIHEGRSVATTMGFTALDGLVMGTRPGALDPGVLLYLMDEHAMDSRALSRLLYHESGLLGVSGVSSDMRVLLASDAPEAQEAVDLFVYRIGREIGSLAAALGGLDALVFTAGIGENAAPIRAAVCRGAEWLGVTLDADANARAAPCISAAGSRASAWIVPTDENRMIARHTYALLAASDAAG